MFPSTEISRPMSCKFSVFSSATGVVEWVSSTKRNCRRAFSNKFNTWETCLKYDKLWHILTCRTLSSQLHMGKRSLRANVVALRSSKVALALGRRHFWSYCRLACAMHWEYLDACQAKGSKHLMASALLIVHCAAITCGSSYVARIAVFFFNFGS